VDFSVISASNIWPVSLSTLSIWDNQKPAYWVCAKLIPKSPRNACCCSRHWADYPNLGMSLNIAQHLGACLPLTTINLKKINYRDYSLHPPQHRRPPPTPAPSPTTPTPHAARHHYTTNEPHRIWIFWIAKFPPGKLYFLRKLLACWNQRKDLKSSVQNCTHFRALID